MRKLGYVLLFGFFLIGIAILIPHSPIYPIAAHYVQKKLESRWNCKVVEKQISVNPLSGNLSFEGLTIKTPEAANPTWHLQIKSATLKISYLSLIRNHTIDRFTLDGVVFKQEYREAAGIPPEKKPSQSEESRKSETDPSPTGRPGAPDGLRIKRLVVRNGSFVYIRIDASGAKQRIKADQISVVRENVYFDKRPDLFFRTIFSTETRF